MEATLLDEIVDVLTTECGMDAKSLRAEALRLYLNTHPTLKLDGAVALWRWQERIRNVRCSKKSRPSTPGQYNI